MGDWSLYIYHIIGHTYIIYHILVISFFFVKYEKLISYKNYLVVLMSELNITCYNFSSFNMILYLLNSNSWLNKILIWDKSSGTVHLWYSFTAIIVKKLLSLSDFLLQAVGVIFLVSHAKCGGIPFSWLTTSSAMPFTPSHILSGNETFDSTKDLLASPQ